MVGAGHSYVARILRPPLGFAGGLGQGAGILCTDQTGGLIPCSSSAVAAVLPGLPGGGQMPIASGQNIQTQPPAVPVAPAPSFGAQLSGLLPWFAVGVVVLLVMPRGSSSSRSAGAAPAAPRRRRR